MAEINLFEIAIIGGKNVGKKTLKRKLLGEKDYMILEDEKNRNKFFFNIDVENYK